MMSLSKPVDIVDLSVPSKFVDIILEEGVVLYAWDKRKSFTVIP